MKTSHRFRKIHLDFHNSPLIPDLGSEFDADQFAATLDAARVNYVVCFAKCHHGMCYYNNTVGARHPALTFDLLGAQIEACHRRDIAVSAYLSVVWEEEAARQHPEWQQLGPDGTPRHKTPGDRWATVCLNSPYIGEVLIPQTKEVCRNYDVDGMWFDMIHLDNNACYCRWCREKARKMGLSYDTEQGRFDFTAASVYAFLDKCSSTIRSIKPDIDIEYNSQVRINARRALPHITGFEIECTPSERGYLYFGMFGRHARTLGLPTRGVSPRFHRIWADFGSLKNEAQFRWETATMLANTSACSIGDQMHPRGRLDAAVYRRIGKAFAAVEEREEWCRDAQPVAEIAVVADDDITDFGIAKASDAVWGASRMLVESHCQFDIVDREADLRAYQLLILADNCRMDPALIAKIREFIGSGGKVIACGLSACAMRRNSFPLRELGVTYAGPTPYSVNYLRLPPSPDDDLAEFDWVVRYPFTEVTPSLGTEVLARTVSPYFERTPEHFTSHHQSPPDKESPYPAITRAGNCIYIAAPLFAAYHRDSDTHCRLIFERCLNALLPDRLVHSAKLPMLEITLTRQAGRNVVHLVNYAATKRGAAPETVEVIPPLRDVRLRVRCAKPAQVYLAPPRQALDFRYAGEYVSVVVPAIDIHQMVVMEGSKE